MDGGVACVMPSTACRELGAEFIITSDVWEYSSLMRAAGCHPARPTHRRFYPGHYLRALHHTDLHIHPSIPIAGYTPGAAAIERMIAAGAKRRRIERERGLRSRSARMFSDHMAYIAISLLSRSALPSSHS